MTTTVVLERVQQYVTNTFSIETQGLNRQRIYIFPTAQGWAYGLMLIVMLLGAINYSNSMAFMLCFLLASLGFVCMLHTYGNLAGLIITATRAEPVFAGQRAMFPLRFDNRTGQQRLAITLAQKPGNGSKYTAQTRIFNIEAGKRTVLLYPVQTQYRGPVKAGRMIIETRFPLGILRAWSYFDNHESCMVYPLPAGRQGLPQETLYREEAGLGQATGTDDFGGFRKYRPGDAMRSIAWKAYAREQGLLSKQFSGTGGKMLVFSWDSVTSLNQIEERLSQLCLWVLIAEESGIRYGLKLPGINIKPSIGPQHRHSCLEKLALFGSGHETD